MKNSRVLLALLTLLPLLSIASGAYAQRGRNPEHDVEATVATQEDRFVLGKVTNKSANVHACVRIMLSLRHPTAQKDLGRFPIYVQNLKAHETRDYSQPLPFPAIATKKYLGKCEWEDVDPVNFPHIISFTVTHTRIFRGETATLEWKTHNTDQVLYNQRRATAPAPRAGAGGRSLALSGSLRVRPLTTTKYYLEAKKGAFSEVSTIIVEVVPYRPDDE